MRSLVVLALLALVATVSASVLSVRTRIPEGWVIGQESQLTQPTNFIIALNQRNIDLLERKLESVSDVMHEDYQNFWTHDQVVALVAPPRAHHDAVVAHLKRYGVFDSQIKSYGDAIEVFTNIKSASKIFNTTYYSFTHTESGKVIHRSFGAFSLPDHVHQFVYMATGVSDFPLIKKQIKPIAPKPNQGMELVIPQTMNIIYQLPTLKPGSHPETSVGVIEYEDEFFSNKDVLAFCTLTNIVGCQTVAPQNIVGTNDPSNPGTESALDINMVTALNTESTPWFWIEDGNSLLYGFSLHIQNVTSAPQITSTSYGWWEDGWCTFDGPTCQKLGVDGYGYSFRVNIEFQKIGVLGITLITASGDSGANGRTDEDCSAPQLRPPFPASSPYVTSVGATELRNGTYNVPNAPAICDNVTYLCLSGGVEAAVSISISGFASGGGFSNVTNALRPAWQNDAVNAYFKSGVQLPPPSMWNQNGRGFPDLGSLGHNGLIVQGGQPEVVGGTSMSSPIYAAIIGLLSETYLNITGKPFGFLNPFLYTMWGAQPNAFTDITLGDNICTESGCNPNCKGFYATKGWDPVTGLGSPNYPVMLAYTQKIGHEVVARRNARAAMRKNL